MAPAAAGAEAAPPRLLEAAGDAQGGAPGLPPGAQEVRAVEAPSSSPTLVTAVIAWAKHPDKCLDVSHGSLAGQPGMDLHIWSCPQSQDDRDRFILPAPGQVGLVRPLKWPHLCLTESGAGQKDKYPRVAFLDCDADTGASRVWKFMTGEMDGSHHLHLADDLSKCLDVPDAISTDGHRLQVWGCHAVVHGGMSDVAGIYHVPEGLSSEEAQKWRDSRKGDESFIITPDPVSCIWDSWAEWSECSATCGSGRSSRYRVVRQQRAFGGTECAGDWVDNQDCYMRDCDQVGTAVGTRLRNGQGSSESVLTVVVRAGASRWHLHAAALLLIALVMLCCLWWLCCRGARRKRAGGELVGGGTPHYYEKEPLIPNQPSAERELRDAEVKISEHPPKPVCCRKGHELVSLGLKSERKWLCDSRNEAGGCRSGIKEAHESKGIHRFRCEECDFDLCQKCYKQRQAILRFEQPQRNENTGGALFPDQSDMHAVITPSSSRPRLSPASTPRTNSPKNEQEAANKRKFHIRPLPTAERRESPSPAS
mmetsp:Transcript_68590/g.201296  ORF Transcript_68590/g.201296 Transcript_68590/m.201296 type:complete len:536 (-) Transcript_68590:47-1654(-)